MNIENGKQTKLSKWLYLLLLGEYDGGIHQHKWIHFIKHILISVGSPDLLNKEVIENPIFTREGFVVSTFRQTLRLTTLKIY